MHAFVRNVSIAAVIVAFAGISAASQAQAEQARAKNDSWYNTYADTSAAFAYTSPSVSVFVSKGTVHRPHHYKPKPKYKHKKHRVHTGGLTRHSRSVERPRYRSHASGYRW